MLNVSWKRKVGKRNKMEITGEGHSRLAWTFSESKLQHCVICQLLLARSFCRPRTLLHFPNDTFFSWNLFISRSRTHTWISHGSDNQHHDNHSKVKKLHGEKGLLWSPKLWETEATLWAGYSMMVAVRIWYFYREFVVVVVGKPPCK